MTDTRRDNTPTSASPPATAPMNRRMMWAMMIGCCLALPLALIIAGLTAGGIAGVRPWLLGLAAVLAVALLIAHRFSNGSRCGTPADRHG